MIDIAGYRRQARMAVSVVDVVSPECTQFSVGPFLPSVSISIPFPQSVSPSLSRDKCHRQVPNQSCPCASTGSRVVFISINLQARPFSDCHHKELNLA